MERKMTMGDRLKGAGSYIWQEGTVYIILLALIIMFSFINPLFFSSKNIYNLISESSYYIIAGMGIVFVMISSDMEEILGMSDRIVVLSEGQVAGELEKDAFSQENVLTLASGLEVSA